MVNNVAAQLHCRLVGCTGRFMLSPIALCVWFDVVCNHHTIHRPPSGRWLRPLVFVAAWGIRIPVTLKLGRGAQSPSTHAPNNVDGQCRQTMCQQPESYNQRHTTTATKLMCVAVGTWAVDMQHAY